ncbi:hypothetical protein BDY19DRAFT_906697 [Irpex rosettiformis]|uniref:Uncharacterized protein n=1 Tax=Irpex rosettiformis TaxID=378272 RepID=A0ACB8U3J3_9APHY|nr:hypothetical protein BDY19DRAFT_906697 [Irpex rosettiformis]
MVVSVGAWLFLTVTKLVEIIVIVAINMSFGVKPVERIRAVDFGFTCRERNFDKLKQGMDTANIVDNSAEVLAQALETNVSEGLKTVVETLKVLKGLLQELVNTYDSLVCMVIADDDFEFGFENPSKVLFTELLEVEDGREFLDDGSGGGRCSRCKETVSKTESLDPFEESLLTFSTIVRVSGGSASGELLMVKCGQSLVGIETRGLPKSQRAWTASSKNLEHAGVSVKEPRVPAKAESMTTWRNKTRLVENNEAEGKSDDKASRVRMMKVERMMTRKKEEMASESGEITVEQTHTTCKRR